MNAQSGPQPHVVYEFGDFQLDASRRLLFAKGVPDALDLKPKVVETILYFVERPGQLLERDRLLAELWPGLVVAEGSLTQVISALRHALGEEPGANRYVATVPGRGYRFVADVVRLLDAAKPEQPAHALSAKQEPDPPRRRAPGVILAVSCVLGAALLSYYGAARWQATHEAPQSTVESVPVAAAPASNAVAVLPFENLSADGADAYFAFGVAEGVLHQLAQNRNIRLIARTSSFAAAARPADARDVGRALNARYLVEGSVQRADERLRVTAQLIDASTGEHRWSLRFDRTVDDIFAVEDEIARSIAEALEVSVVGKEHPYARFGTNAYLAYLEGRALLAKRTVTEAERAVESFSRAIEIAPDFAAAYAALAEAHTARAFLLRGSPEVIFLGRPEHRRDLLAAAAADAEPLLARALALDDSLGEAYVLRADLKAIKGDSAGAEVDYRKGLALDPNDSVAHEHFATFLGTQGRIEEAHVEIDRALLIDPLSPRTVYRKGFTYLYSEETGIFGEQSEVYFLKALELAPDYHPALIHIGAIRWHQGRFADAIRLGEQAVNVEPRSDWLRAHLVEFYLELGEVDAARSVLAKAPEPARPIENLAICWYMSNLEAAADLLRAEPHASGFYDHDVEAYVLRDAALTHGDLARAQHDLLTLPSRPGRPVEDDPFRLVTLAQVSLAQGDRPEAERLARQMLDFKDWLAHSSTQYRLAYPKAAALTLLGENDAALDVLEESFARGYRKRWWYAFDRDPVFEPLRSDPRFQALTAKAHAHADAERKVVDEMRERGEVPRRAEGEVVPGGC